MSITQPNLVQQESRLKALPDDALRAMLLQMGQTGQVGSAEYLLAAGEMQARKTLREKAAAGQPQQPPVIAELLSPPPQPMETTGVAALPAPNMDQMQQPQFANGGIVAFSEGGSSTNPYRNYTPFRGSYRLPPEEEERLIREGRLPTNFQKPSLSETLAQINQGFVQPVADFFTKSPPLSEMARRSQPSAGPAGPSTPGDLRRLEAAAGDPYVTRPPNADVPMYDPSKFAPLPSAEPTQPVRPQAGVADLFSRSQRIAGQIAPPLPSVPSTLDAITEQNQAMRLAGYDPKLFEKQIKDIRDSSTSQADRKEAVNMRLLEAGLGIMAGTSPHAFVNIGKGAAPALQGLAEDIKDIKKADRERERAIRDLQNADNQSKAGVGLAAIKARQDAQVRYDNAQGKVADLKASIFQTLTSADTSRYVAETGLASARENTRARTDDTLRTKALELAERTVRENPTNLSLSDAQRPALIQQYQASYFRMLQQQQGGGASGATPRYTIRNNTFVPVGTD